MFYALARTMGREWVSQNSSNLFTSTGIVSALFLLIEGVLAVWLIIWPWRSRRLVAIIWSCFAVVHLISIVDPRLGRCPCLGEVPVRLGQTATHWVWLALCIGFVVAALYSRRSLDGATVKGACPDVEIEV